MVFGRVGYTGVPVARDPRSRASIEAQKSDVLQLADLELLGVALEAAVEGDQGYVSRINPPRALPPPPI